MQDRVGGRVATFRKGNYVADLGAMVVTGLGKSLILNFFSNGFTQISSIITSKHPVYLLCELVCAMMIYFR